MQTVISLPSSPLLMKADEHLLEQGLYNLLLNAIDASPSGSRIEIEADAEPAEVRLTIRDQGPGMPFTPNPGDLSPGPTTKRFGTGLGIPFAFKVCEALGGKLSYEHAPQGGTLVTLRLPRARG